MKDEKYVLMEKLNLNEKQAEEFIQTHTQKEVERECYSEVD